MKKIAMLIAFCMLTMGMAAYAEEAQPAPENENLQTEAPDMAEEEIDREVWRGEVMAIEDGSLTLKILEYNPEHAKLPMPELPEGEMPEDIPAEEEQSPAVAMNQSEGMPEEAEDAGQEAAGSEEETGNETAGGEKMPFVEIVSITTTEETLYYTCADAETNETVPEEDENAGEMPEDAEANAPVSQYVFEEAAHDDIAAGDVVTVEIIDGAASIVVIETDAAVQEEVGM